jgi:hypothetical protein
MKLITRQFSAKKLSDAGMAFILLSLLTGYFLRMELFYLVAMIATIANMINPKFFYPFAVVWYPFSRFLGHIMSTLILSLVYIILVIPMGIFRRLTGSTKSEFTKFHKSDRGAMHVRDHTFTATDLSHPY